VEAAAAQLVLRIGAVLMNEGVLTPQQLGAALVECDESGKRLGEVVVEQGWATSRDVAQALAKQHGLEFFDLEGLEIDERVAERLPVEIARLHGAIPVAETGDGELLVAVADPTDAGTCGDLELALGQKIRLAVCAETELAGALDRVYGPPGLRTPAASGSEAWNAANATTAVKIVKAALGRAIELGATDIHFEPGEQQMIVRGRVDGVVRELTRVPRAAVAGVTTRLKIMGQLDITQRRLPQDGSFAISVDGERHEFGITAVPTARGERIVLRVLRRGAALGLSDLGMAEDAEAALVRAIRRPHGAVVVCGPGGSGRTTTLYSALSLLNEPDRVLMTIEDPIEFPLEGVSQVEVSDRGGVSFARGLASVLRSDPDVLLVGELHDRETTRLALDAAARHLVLTTLHAQDTASAVARLGELGAAPGLLATSLTCIVAQRLARQLCGCSEAYEASPDDAEGLGLHADVPVTLYRPSGCPRCDETGYRGRAAIYEVMPVEGDVVRALDYSVEDVRKVALQYGMRTLRGDAARLCLAGVTSASEVHRILGRTPSSG
jgi:type IV pilus assembly protein PilB